MTHEQDHGLDTLGAEEILREYQRLHKALGGNIHKREIDEDFASLNWAFQMMRPGPPTKAEGMHEKAIAILSQFGYLRSHCRVARPRAGTDSSGVDGCRYGQAVARVLRSASA